MTVNQEASDSLAPAFLDGDGDRVEPASVRVLKVLGKGRAAKAQLVDATMADGSVHRCVEKVFAPGRLTRTIYRLSFQAPFGYQKNRDAILTAFYRRRVAAAAIAASDVQADVAMPMYVRYSESDQAWVLAAQWVNGRGIKPEPANPKRVYAFAGNDGDRCEGEISQLLAIMTGLEKVLSDCGLVGSGWQVAPRAMVSTANLLRTGDRYTVIDLESGIPAVLVPKYILAGLRRGVLPPFDDLDAGQVQNWYETNKRLLQFRLSMKMYDELQSDIDRLVHHAERWKQSELAVCRRPWKFLQPSFFKTYQEEYVRQLIQGNTLDTKTAAVISKQSFRVRAMWWLGLIPTRLGPCLQRAIGNRDYRASVLSLVSDARLRRQKICAWVAERQSSLIATERAPATWAPWRGSVVAHAAIAKLLPTKLHRGLTDPQVRAERRLRALLLIASPTYQSWFGRKRIEKAISSWRDEGRISDAEKDSLDAELCGVLVRAYMRGFGLHVALKTLAPLWVPIKIAGTAMFATTGNPWCLMPFLITPAMRFLVTLQSRWMNRKHHVPHAEAMAMGWLPVVGLIAFPMQMFSARPNLSTFLIRDFAAKLGRRVPIYGGKDSRTEIAMIRATDWIIAMMQGMSAALTRLGSRPATMPSQEPVLESFQIPRTRWGRWLEWKAQAMMAKQQRSQCAPVGLHDMDSEHAPVRRTG